MVSGNAQSKPSSVIRRRNPERETSKWAAMASRSPANRRHAASTSALPRSRALRIPGHLSIRL